MFIRMAKAYMKLRALALHPVVRSVDLDDLDFRTVRIG